MEIIVAKTAGFCYGVKRALEMVNDSLKEEDSPICSLGPLIHNPAVVLELERKGLKVVSRIDEAAKGRVVIRSHGVGPGTYRYAADHGLQLIDATCPFVKNVQELASILKHDGYQVIIIGESDHAEVQGVLETVSGEALVLENPDDLQGHPIRPKVGIISQTTQDIATFQSWVARIVPLTKECRIFNTICLATTRRQQETAELSRKVDLLIVVGGKNSANTNRLAEISRQLGTTTYQVESAQELQPEWFLHLNQVGITAGASTPDGHIAAVIDKIKSLGGTVRG